MKCKQLIARTNNNFLLKIKDASGDNTLMSGQIKELNDEMNKAYKRIRERELVDFYITHGMLILYIE